MRLGEVKIEALKIMFADYTGSIDVDSLQDLKTDENYEYINSMPGAINRCFSRLEDANVVPLKKTVLEKDKGIVSNGRIRFDLNEVVEDFDKVDRIIHETVNSYNGNCEYVMETESIIVLPEVDEDYTLIYAPRLKRVTTGTADDEEIALPDKIACLIPYFIKGDLFREDEPAEAADARNLFEASIEAIDNGIKRRQTSVKTVFSQTEE